jgi:DNA-binding MarR family transcriptional regulator
MDPVGTFGQLLYTTTLLERRLGRGLEESCDLPHTWFEILLHLERSPDRRMTIGDLGRGVLLTSGGITRLIDRMVVAGLVAREACPSDRRVQWVVPTPSGRKRLSEALKVHVGNVDELITNRLSDAELRTLLTLLGKITPEFTE